MAVSYTHLGLAQMLKEKGYIVSGSDNLETYTTRHLRDDLNIPVTIGKGNVLMDGSDAVIFTCGLMVSECLKAAELIKDCLLYTSRCV